MIFSLGPKGPQGKAGANGKYILFNFNFYSVFLIPNKKILSKVNHKYTRTTIRIFVVEFEQVFTNWEPYSQPNQISKTELFTIILNDINYSPKAWF